MRATMICGLGAALMLGACGGGEQEAATAEASGKDASASAPAGGGAVSGGGTLRIRPGLWRTVRREPGGEAETDEKCVTPEEATIDGSDFTGPTAQGCTHATSRQGGAFVYKASCPTGQGLPPTEMEMRVRTQGDTRYNADMTMALTIPGQGRQTMNVQIEGSYVGPCPAGAAEE